MDLGAQRLRRLQHVQQLRVVDLQQHAGYFSCQRGVHVLDQGEETLTWNKKHQTLHLGEQENSAEGVTAKPFKYFLKSVIFYLVLKYSTT